MLGVVLAAGKGERMHPLSTERPKALLPTLDVPQLTWALAGLKAAGVRRAWVNARATPVSPETLGSGVGITRGVDRTAAAPGHDGPGITRQAHGAAAALGHDRAGITREIDRAAATLSHDGADVDRAASVRGHGGTIITREVERAAAALDLDVEVSVEPEEPLGTAGALGKLRAELRETFLLVNADVASSVPLGQVVEAHLAAGALATLVGIPTRNRADLVAEDGWVVGLVDRGRRVSAGHVYAGIGVFEPEVLRHVPDGVSHLFDTVMCGLVRDAGNRGLAVFEWTGFWSDLADPAAHLRVNLQALTGTLTGARTGALPGPPGVMALQGPVQRWDPLAYVGPGAEVEGAELVHAVVGAGARVEPGTRLERCVAWDGAVVERGAFRDAVLTPYNVVEVGVKSLVKGAGGP